MTSVGLSARSVASRLVVAPDAATRLAAAGAFVRSVPSGTEVLVLAPSWDAGDELVRVCALDAGALFGVSRLLLDRLAGLLAAAELAPRGRAPAGGLSVEAIAARAIHLVGDELRYFGPVARRPGFPRAVARTIHELRMNAVASDALATLGAGGADLALLARRIDHELDAADLADRAAVYEAALAAVDRAPAPPWIGMTLVLFDVPLVAAREVALVRALVARAPAVFATAAVGDEQTVANLEHALGCRRDRGVSARPVDRSPAPSSSLLALQTHLFEESAPVRGDVDDSVALQCWPGEARECVEIARAVQREAARGVPFDRMAVFLHAPEAYGAHLEEALRRAAIPAFFAGGTKRPDTTGRALLALLACKAEGLSARRFAEYLSLARVPDLDERSARAADPDALWAPPQHELAPPAADEQAPSAEPVVDEPMEEPLPREPDASTVVSGAVRAPWRWEQLLVDAAVIGSKERWVKRLDGLERELRLRRGELDGEDEARAALADREIADLIHLRAFALPLIEMLDALPRSATWGEWLAELRALAAAALREPAALLTALAELDPMAPVGPVEIDEVQLVLRARLRELRVRPPRRRYGAVFIAPAEAARGLVFDVVFIPGLAEKVFPRKIVEDPILLDASRLALAIGGLAIQPSRVAAERLALRLAVGAARERIYLSYPRIDVEQARPRVPSFYTLEALRAVEGALPGFEAMASRASGDTGARLGWPAPADPALAIDDAEYDLALLPRLLEGDPTVTKGAARYLLGANPHLARALRARAYRWLHRWTPADGLVDPDDLALAALARHQLPARSFSPTALQNFATCPYRFFLQAIHRLKPRDEPVAIEQLDPLTRGALFHEVQFATLTALRADDVLPVRAATLEHALAVVDRCLDAVAARYREDLYPAIARVWDDGIEAIRADLREWLRREAAAESGWVPYRFELSFGLAGRERGVADPASIGAGVAITERCTLRGSIDLVERHERGTIRVTDHKTGKVRARSDVVVGGGEILQPVLYALAAERMLPERVAAGRLYYCTAAGGYEERTVVLDATSRDLAGEVIAIIDRALSSGFLPAVPGPRACAYCDYRPVCGPYEEERARRKPKHRLGDLERLRMLP